MTTMLPANVDHWSTFPAFVRTELAAGGPDPQLAVLDFIAARERLQDRVWLIGCYGAHHCLPSAVNVWRRWSADSVLRHPDVFRIWLAQHWTSLPVRPEMRSHRMLAKRVQCLTDFAQFATTWMPTRYATYDELWDAAIGSVKYFGRYMAIKVLEMLRRFGGAGYAVLPDLRAKGGWSPRRALAMLWPEVTRLAVREDERPATLHVVNAITRATQGRLHTLGVDVSLFQLQVLLCEYKEAIEGTYYAGASHDEELVYIATARRGFEEDQGFHDSVLMPIFRARRTLFDHRFLGEIGGWSGPRKECYVAFRTPRSEEAA